jgi:hypothetical protein
MIILNQATLFEGLPILSVNGDPRRFSQSMHSLSAHSSNDELPARFEPYVDPSATGRHRGYSNPIPRPGPSETAGRPRFPEGMSSSQSVSATMGFEGRSTSLPPGAESDIIARPVRPTSMRTPLVPSDAPPPEWNQGNQLPTLGSGEDGSFALYAAYETNRGPSPQPPPPISMPPMPPGAGSGPPRSASMGLSGPGAPPSSGGIAGRPRHRKERSSGSSHESAGGGGGSS